MALTFYVLSGAAVDRYFPLVNELENEFGEMEEWISTLGGERASIERL